MMELVNRAQVRHNAFEIVPAEKNNVSVPRANYVKQLTLCTQTYYLVNRQEISC